MTRNNTQRAWRAILLLGPIFWAANHVRGMAPGAPARRGAVQPHEYVRFWKEAEERACAYLTKSAHLANLEAASRGTRRPLMMSQSGVQSQRDEDEGHGAGGGAPSGGGGTAQLSKVGAGYPPGVHRLGAQTECTVATETRTETTRQATAGSQTFEDAEADASSDEDATSIQLHSRTLAALDVFRGRCHSSPLEGVEIVPIFGKLQRTVLALDIALETVHRDQKKIAVARFVRDLASLIRKSAEQRTDVMDVIDVVEVSFSTNNDSIEDAEAEQMMANRFRYLLEVDWEYVPRGADPAMTRRAWDFFCDRIRGHSISDGGGLQKKMKLFTSLRDDEELARAIRAVAGSAGSIIYPLLPGQTAPWTRKRFQNGDLFQLYVNSTFQPLDTESVRERSAKMHQPPPMVKTLAELLEWERLQEIM